MSNDEETAEARVFREEHELCDRFIAEFGGIYNSQGTRHRVIIYAETIRQIFEYTRYLRDTAIGESIEVDQP